MRSDPLADKGNRVGQGFARGARPLSRKYDRTGLWHGKFKEFCIYQT